MSFTQRTPRAGDRRRLHYRRSRNGCLTCKRRKVRCDEQMPTCHNCQRLRMVCEWKQRELDTAFQPEMTDNSEMFVAGVEALHGDAPSYSPAIFDFGRPTTGPLEHLTMFDEDWFASVGDFTQTGIDLHDGARIRDPNFLPPAQMQQPHETRDEIAEESSILQTFPILEPVENGPRGASLRTLLDGMTECSSMVRYSMRAFTAMRSRNIPQTSDYRQDYRKAEEELSDKIHSIDGRLSVHHEQLKYVLMTIFLLTYTDVLTDRLDLAYSHLANIHNILRSSGHGATGPTERRITSWIRLLDARAAAAGGEGCLVGDASGIYSSSPSSTVTTENSSVHDSVAEAAPREMIYNLLCQPGIDFLQDVQTITGRIARLGHDRRKRGSVEDETEVMAAASYILKDLASLYHSKPAIMDHFLSGMVGVDTLAEPLSMAIRRSFQTFLANYYACCVHLHRVAHRHLPRSQQVITAIQKIKEIMHLMVDNSESLPVNMLWPLFMWGSEEDDEKECRWILQTMRNNRCAATNAGLAARLLEVVQTRQREAMSRIDIHSVCIELFNCNLVIV